MKLSSDPEASRRLLEELIENHRRAPDGRRLRPPGNAQQQYERRSVGL